MKVRFCLLLLLIILTGSCGNYPKAPAAAEPAAEAPKPKNIILLIGDGMGIAQISAGMIKNGYRLHLEQFPITGLHKPQPVNELITDSAAGATAFASGVKTYNGAIGVNKDTIPTATILEELENKGWATGLVATSSITHATPASFIAHVSYRDKMEEIATFFLKTDIDLFIGGGKKYFDQRKKDNRNLLAELSAKGYQVMDIRQKDIRGFSPDYSKKLAFFTADEEPAPVGQGRTYLPAASRMAMEFLDRQSDKGFFLMIEGSQIDWGGHANNTDYIVSEMIDFDQAIGEALSFARADKETLVIVTADHETGGFAINPGTTLDSIVGAFTSDSHTAALIPVFAFGPGAKLFSGLYDNTQIYHRMRQAMGFTAESPSGKR